MKLIKFHTLAAMVAIAVILNLGAVPDAQAVYTNSLSYCTHAQDNDTIANYYQTFATYTGDSTHEYYAYSYSYDAYLQQFYCYLYAPGGTYTGHYAYYAYQNAYQRYYNALLVYLGQAKYTDGAYYDYLFDIYRGYAMFYAAYQQ